MVIAYGGHACRCVCWLQEKGSRITVTEGGTEASTGLPPSSGFGGGRGQRSGLAAVSAGTADTTSVEAVKEQSSQGVQKPPVWVGQKQFLGACWTASEVIRRTYQQVFKQDPLTCWRATSEVTLLVPGGRLRRCRMPCWAVSLMQGFRRLVEMIFSRVLARRVKERKLW
jgi:hypothetical protein